MPILGSNLVKTGVQGVIFDNSSSAACHIAKIMNFGQFGKKNQYFKGGEVLKIRNLQFFFTKSVGDKPYSARKQSRK